MAGHASGACQVVVIVDVTVGAGARWHGMQSGEREPGGVVIKRGIQPGAGAMTLLAGLREIRRHVIRIGGALEVLQVAGDAGRACQVVIIVDVTIGAGAGRHSVQAGESKASGGVVELRIGPHHGIVALLARRGKSIVRHRRGRVVVVRLVAADAGRIRNVVVVVDVAISTLPRWNRVRTSERES